MVVSRQGGENSIPSELTGKDSTRQEAVTGFDESGYRRLLTKLFADWTEWRLTGDDKFLSSVIAAAKKIDKQSQGKTTPIGIFHSAGSGFETAPLSSIAELLRTVPEAELYGYVKLSTKTAEFSAKCYEHCRRLYSSAQDRGPDLENLSLDNLVRHAYIPTPNLINGMPVIGPILISEDVSVQFLNWVKGPLMHDQFGATKKAKTLNGIISELQHNQLWVVSQMTGVWQANPCSPDPNKPEALGELVKTYYANTAVGSLSKYASFVGLPASTDNIRRAEKAVETIALKLVVSTDPLSGNIGKPFDSALRNFISEVGDVDATADDVLNRVFKSGAIDYYRLWDVTRRIDFSNFDRKWCIYDEDIAHITENLNVTASEGQKEQYRAAVTLTRLALLHHNAFEAGQKRRLNQAIELADSIQAVQRGELKPSEVAAFKDYVLNYEPTVKIMPWLRKLRQGVLALVYLSKTYAYEAKTNLPANQSHQENLTEEAQDYLSRVIGELPAVISAAGMKRDQNVSALEGLLNEVLGRIMQKNFSKDYMLDTGSRYLTTLR